MLQRLLNKRDSRRQKGFTIIEVMIVLAIAGLILAVVLIAIPQLQRNQRNSARQSIMARVTTELGNYSGNNNGNIPLNAADLTSFTTRYLTNIDIKDPSSGNAMAITKPAAAPTVGNVPTGTQGAISYYNGLSCNGEKIAAGTARSFAVWTQLEGGAIYCLDNL